MSDFGYLEKGGTAEDKQNNSAEHVSAENNIKNTFKEYDVIPDDATHVPKRSTLKEAMETAKWYYGTGRAKKIEIKDSEGNLVLSIKSFGDYYSKFGNLIPIY